jgi:hypothetical protein
MIVAPGEFQNIEPRAALLPDGEQVWEERIKVTRGTGTLSTEIRENRHASKVRAAPQRKVKKVVMAIGRYSWLLMPYPPRFIPPGHRRKSRART